MNSKQLKFRAWSNRDKKWIVEGFHIIGETTVFDMLNESRHRLQEYDDIKIQQFTGVLDKNGKEIYEGDILYYEMCKDHPTVVVRWSEEGHDFHPCLILCDNWGQYGDKEIIGNIYENPELL
jgi:hypothetical protein